MLRVPSAVFIVVVAAFLALSFAPPTAHAYGLWAVADNETAPVSFYNSRPEISPPALQLQVYDREHVSPGYIFVAPWRRTDTGPDPGPYIYDNYGDLIWSGATRFGGVSAHGPHVCQYHGRDHLCFFQGASHVGFARGVGLILDNTYQVVKAVQSSGSMAAGDMHEFRLVDGGRGAVVTVFQVHAYDLSPYGLEDGVGWIVESVFQEIRVDTGDLMFEWRSLDHEETSPKHSRVLPGQTPVGGLGTMPAAAWDYFHINSIDKNRAGDYLISARHMSAIYKISGKTGKIMWQLNGQGDGAFAKDFNFSSQHDARWHNDNATHSIISLFDNASDDWNETSTHSRGMLIEISHESKTATLLTEYVYPDRTDLLCGSQGNTQLLGNGNAFIGWGEMPFFSEHRADGSPVLSGEVAHEGSKVMMYRARKFNWTATPSDTPSLWTYALPDSNETVFYVSWNGATTVDSWNFYTAPNSDGPWSYVGSANRTGFETRFHSANHTTWAFAEAISASGHMLRRSSIARTFVPSPALRPSCDALGCKSLVPDPDAPPPNGSPPQVLRPDQVSFTLGLEGNSHYPPQPPRPAISILKQVLPPILLGLGALLLVTLFWLSPKMMSRLCKDKKLGEYVKVEQESSPPDQPTEGA